MTKFLSHFIIYDLFIFTTLIFIYGFLKLILFLQVEACIIQESSNLLIAITIESFCFRILFTDVSIPDLFRLLFMQGWKFSICLQLAVGEPWCAKRVQRDFGNPIVHVKFGPV